jgi:hypothetical protein
MLLPNSAAIYQVLLLRQLHAQRAYALSQREYVLLLQPAAQSFTTSLFAIRAPPCKTGLIPATTPKSSQGDVPQATRTHVDDSPINQRASADAATRHSRLSYPRPQ